MYIYSIFQTYLLSIYIVHLISSFFRADICWSCESQMSHRAISQISPRTMRRAGQLQELLAGANRHSPHWGLEFGLEIGDGSSYHKLPGTISYLGDPRSLIDFDGFCMNIHKSQLWCESLKVQGVDPSPFVNTKWFEFVTRSTGPLAKPWVCLISRIQRTATNNVELQ